MTRLIPSRRLAAALLLSAAAAAPALAQDTSLAALQPQQVQSLTFVSGGVTIDEATAVKRMAAQYPLRVVMSGRGGDYYIAQSMTVMQGGRVLAELTDAGPWLLMDLPPGRYTLQGRFEGLTMSRDVTVTAGKGTTVHWVVPPAVN